MRKNFAAMVMSFICFAVQYLVTMDVGAEQWQALLASSVFAIWIWEINKGND